MNTDEPLASRLPAAVLTGLALGVLFAYLWLWTFHPDHDDEGPIEFLSHVSTLEVVLATAFGITVFGVTVWRILRGSTPRDEVDRAVEVLDEDGGD
jgi:hypothetical protein